MMVLKEDLCEWFKDLHPPKRLEYLCCLLHVCLPIELRFVSSVVEDLCKREYMYLRDREDQANDAGYLSENQSYSLSDPNLRHKLLIALALINSTNSRCIEIVYNILKRPENRLNALSETTLTFKDAADEIELILTMTLHHPAIKFTHKLNLGDMLKSFQERIHEFHNDTMERELHLPSRKRPQLFKRQVEKGALVSIEVKAIRESNYKKGGPEHQIHATWSNGDVSEVFMKFKPLQDVHHSLVYKFTEFRKQHTNNVPVFPGKQQFLKETDQEKINSLNSYFRELMKAPSQVANCDIWPEAMRKGKTIKEHQQQVLIPHQHYFIPRNYFDDQNIPTTWPPQYTLQQFARLPLTSSTSPGHLKSPSQLSSNTESPINSRTSSPALAPQYYSSNQTSPCPVNGPLVSPVLPHDLPEQMSNDQQCLKQLLQLLDMESSYKNLCQFSLKQVMSMNKEEFAKAGLPLDAQEKMLSRLDHWNKTQQETGPPEEPPFQVLQIQPSSLMQGTSLLPGFIQYPGQPSPAALASPASLVTASGSSTANSEVSSPPASPSQLAIAALDSPLVASNLPEKSKDPCVLPLVPPILDVTSTSTSDMKPPTKCCSPPRDVSDSEDEGGENTTLRSKPESDSQGSFSRKISGVSTDPEDDATSGSMTRSPSMPASIDSSTELISPGSSPALPMVTGPPQVHPSAAIATAVPLNGYISDPPPLLHQNMRPVLNPRPFNKGAQPTHTAPGLHKNIVTMPMHNIPQPVGKGVAMLPPGLQPMPHTYMAPPSVTTATTSHGVQGMVMGQTNQQTNNNNILPQQHPTHQITNHVSDTPNNFHFPQLILRPPSIPGPMHQRNVFTASTGSVMTTTQSHSVGPPSQSPSPVTTVVPTDQAPPPTGGTIYQCLPMSDLSVDRGPTGTPPNQPPPVLVNKPPTSGTNTPSPPLVNITQSNKQPNVNCSETTPVSGAPPQVYIQHQISSQYLYSQLMSQAHQPHNPNNGLVTPMPTYFQQAQAQPHYPNGVNPELYIAAAAAAARFPHPQGQVNPLLYGNSFPAHNQMLPHGTLQTAVPTGVPPPIHNGHSVHNNHGHNGQVQNSQGQNGQGQCVQRQNGISHVQPNGNNPSNKSNSCYNCGYSGHRAADCKESIIANDPASLTFRLNCKPKSDSE